MEHAIGPKTVKNGDKYFTVPKRNMRRSARGNLVQWVNLWNARRASSWYNHSYCVISHAVASWCITKLNRAPSIFQNDWFCTRISNSVDCWWRYSVENLRTMSKSTNMLKQQVSLIRTRIRQTVIFPRFICTNFCSQYDSVRVWVMCKNENV